MKLIQLPNGSWIDPEIITAVRLLPTSVDAICGTHRARVIVWCGAHPEIITANDNEHAQQLANEYAKIVNSSRNP